MVKRQALISQSGLWSPYQGRRFETLYQGHWGGARTKVISGTDWAPLWPLPRAPLTPQSSLTPHEVKIPTLTNHLMPLFQQEFSLSWGYKNWLLIHKNCWLSLVCQGLSVHCAHNAHFISVLDQLTPLYNAVSGNSFPTHAQIASTLLELCPRPTGLEMWEGVAPLHPCFHKSPWG